MTLAPMIMIGGTDGSGKGLVVDTLVELAKKNNSNIFDLRKHEKENPFHPHFDNVKNHEIFVAAEPTHSEAGYAIRQLLKVNHSAKAIAEGFSFDRYNLDTRLTIPCRKNNIPVIKERGFESSFVYQYELAKHINEPLSMKEIMSLQGNRQAFEEYPPTHLIICHCPVETSIKRLSQRDKKDDAIYEKKKDFMQAVLDRYLSSEIKKIFEEKGIEVIYFDTDTDSPETTKKLVEENLWPIISKGFYNIN
ncbi:MAG: dTMP kinase [Candidatus Woesearchaeota archaeon]